ncbi:MAG: penicillin-binding protein activator [Rhodobacterales bacterium]|nr:penicillin-binding protein activator [Rhodobacterales bacterium]
MFARLFDRRKAASRIVAALSMLWLAACDPTLMAPGVSGGGGPAIDPSDPVQVALLVPRGSGDPSDDFLATNLENAARLAISDLSGVSIDLRVYSTGASPALAAQAAQTAIGDGAQIILGPLYAEAANAAGVVAAPAGINVLSFSNNTTIAGGNVFVLGPTFRNTANRLVRHGVRNGIDSYVIVHADDLQGAVGRDAIASAVRGNGGRVAGIQSYPLSQQGILDAVPRIAEAARSGGAGAVFLTAGVNADLPILATALPEAGINPAATRYIGLTRWNASAEALALPGLQGGLFAVPDQQMTAIFESRYEAAYGGAPHPLAGLAYDGIAAIGALVASGNRGALTRAGLTQPQGFQGIGGIFRLLADGTNERGLAVATIRNNQVVILERAPRTFGGGS